MKKLFTFMMVAVLAIGTVSLTGCGGDKKKKDDKGKDKTEKKEEKKEEKK